MLPFLCRQESQYRVFYSDLFIVIALCNWEIPGQARNDNTGTDLAGNDRNRHSSGSGMTGIGTGRGQE